MDGEVARLSEGSGTLGTLEWFVSIVDSHVDLEGRGPQEHLLADLTRQFLALVFFGLVGRSSEWQCRHHGWHTTDIRKYRGLVVVVECLQQRRVLGCVTELWMHTAVGELTLSCNWDLLVYLPRDSRF